MVTDANVTDGVPTADEATATPAEPDAGQAHAEPEAPPGPISKQRTWSMPKSPVTREHADEAGRIALSAGAAIAGFLVSVARYGAGLVGQLIRGIEAVPPMLRTLTLLGVLMLLGIVGSIARHDTLGVVCTVVVVPVCAIALGALGYRWFSGLGGQRVPHTESPAAQVAASELQRSVEYVDTKLTAALNAFGAERHQSALIALFQAKTAVELTLGTEHTAATNVEALFSSEDHYARPRIRVGATPKSVLCENNSLAAS